MAGGSQHLDDIVASTRRKISDRETDLRGRAARADRARLPRYSVALCIWVVVVVVVAWQYPKLQTWFFAPSDTVVEQDLTRILESTALAIEARRDEDGRLPDRLPNPALRGMVDYAPDGLGSFRLSARVGEVAMEYDARMGHARRVR